MSATVRGVRAADRCEVVVLTRHERRKVAASWLTSARGEREDTHVAGAAIVAPNNVGGVAVLTSPGRSVTEAGQR